MALLAAFTLSMMAVVNYLTRRDLLFPAVLQSGLWAVIMFLFFFNQSYFFPLHSQSYYLIVGGALFFSIGCNLQALSYRFDKGKIDLSKFQPNRTILWIMTGIALIGLPIVFSRAYAAGVSGPTTQFLTNLRLRLGSTDQPSLLGPFGYMPTLANVCLAIHLLIAIQTGKHRLPLTLALLISVGHASITVGRTFLFFIVILCMGLLLITRRLKVSTAAFLFAGLGLPTFVLIGLVSNKGGSLSATFAQNIASMQHNLRIYLLSAVPAMDVHMQSENAAMFGVNTFRTLLAVAARLGQDVSVPRLVKEFVAIPELTNVFTIYRPYFDDFLMLGALVAQLLIGFGHGFIYQRAIRNRPFFIFLYALSLYPLFMQFFQDQYFSLLSTWIQYITLFFVYVYIFSRSSERTTRDELTPLRTST